MNTPNWSHPSPVFLDFETQSAADIREVGGRAYASHPSTRVLILALAVDGSFHVWIPDYITKATLNPGMLWPHVLKPRQTVTLYRGNDPRESLTGVLDSIKDRPLVAHNAYGFDRFVWDRFIQVERDWLDSVPLARAAGRGGRLDAIAKSVLGSGKDAAKKLLPKLTVARAGGFFADSEYTYPAIALGELEAFTRYAVADVELLRRLWVEFDSIQVEADVIAANDSINNRGVECDIPLLETIRRLSRYAVYQAAERIAEITRGKLHAGNIRSTKQVHEWLDSWGIKITDDSGKPCLRKDIVTRFLDSPFIVESNLLAVREIPPEVIEVLKLRLSALRITDAKVDRAIGRMDTDGRLKDLHAYHAAHTGRFSSYGVQIHNLPRPKRGIAEQVEHLLASETRVPFVPRLDHNNLDAREQFDSIKANLPESLSVDDVCSALLRPALRAAKGYTFAIADFAQVEARGAAWLAGETKMLDAFFAGRDLYREFAAVMFGVPLVDVTKLHRQIAKSAILGCQYNLGANKFRIYAANSGCDLVAAGVTAEQVIDTYRDEYTRIAGWRPNRGQSFRVGGLWKGLDAACKETVSTGAAHSANRIGFRMQSRDLVMILPSGREIHYPNARIEDIVPPYVYTLGLDPIPKATVVFDSDRGLKSLYGGLLTENAVQAMCRDIMAHMLVTLETKGFRPVLHVHDEIVCEVPVDRAAESLRELVRIMSTAPEWCSDFPLEVEGYTCPRFAKEPYLDSIKIDTRKVRG